MPAPVTELPKPGTGIRGTRIRLLSLIALFVVSHAAAAAVPAAFEIELLATGTEVSGPQAMIAGAYDDRFGPYTYKTARNQAPTFWLRLRSTAAPPPAASPALIVTQGRHLDVGVYRQGAEVAKALPAATSLPGFRGVHDVIHVLPAALQAGDVLYALVSADGRGGEELRFAAADLATALARGVREARMITLTFGALLAVSIAAMLIWFVLADRMFILYAALFFMQALYIAYLSGHGFDWPILSLAAPLTSHAWNVPAALSGAAACLFVREIADVRTFSQRAYSAFGAFAVAFVAVAVSNAGQRFGLGPLVALIGNLVFVAAAVFTLVVVAMAWRRGSRPAGWFLVAWLLLEAFTIATAVSLLRGDTERADGLLYFGLPLSMVAASLLIGLGVADRLREQRVALSEAERHAQTDPLTGVLNRRSLIERLEAASSRARARGLPLALLFIDLDHFKRINDTHGHPAGDACLAAIIAPIQSELRQSDVIGRYGGEEFVVILSSADASAARLIAERILLRVAAVRVPGFGTPIDLTCSIGVASSDAHGVWGEELVARADAAVYAAKRGGRNRVWVAEAPA